MSTLRVGQHVRVYVPGSNGGGGTIRGLRITNMGLGANVECDHRPGCISYLFEGAIYGFEVEKKKP